MILLIIVYTLLCLGLLTFSISMGSTRSRQSIRTLHPSDYAWGEGKDLSDLLPVISPDFPKIMADTAISELERQWDNEHPSELAKAEKAWGRQIDKLLEENKALRELVDSKSSLIAKQTRELNFYRQSHQHRFQLNSSLLDDDVTHDLWKGKV